MVELNIKLPENFLDEEVRCGYTVSHEMKEIWAVEIDILVKILDVCKKYGINIYTSGGTTLGAIRHGGFIPWDDDIDLELDRDNYNKLCKIGPQEFEFPYFFQTEYTDPGSLRGHIQVRRSDTTGILKNELVEKKTFNQGIFVDVFPFDFIPDDENEEIVFRRNLAKLKKKAAITNMSYHEYKQSNSIVKSIIKSLYYPLMKLTHKESIYYYKKMEKLAIRYNGTNCKRMAAITFSPFRTSNTCDKDVFEKKEMHKFEFIEVPVSTKYDQILKHSYGDYNKFVYGGSLHGGVFFDTSKSYKYYLEHTDEI